MVNEAVSGDDLRGGGGGLRGSGGGGWYWKERRYRGEDWGEAFETTIRFFLRGVLVG